MIPSSLPASEGSNSDPLRTLPHAGIRFGLAMILCGVTLGIGLIYSGGIYITGWQFWVWLFCWVAISALFVHPSIHITRRELLILLGLFLAALFLRATMLEMIPGLLHTDENVVARFARDRIWNPNLQYFNIFVNGPSSQPALFHYILHYTMQLFGYSIFGLRISSAVAGSLGVLCTYWMVRYINGKHAAVITALLMTTYHFGVHYSRIGLNNIWDTIWVPIMVYGFFKAWKENSINGAVIAGLALGLSQYFYHGSKIGFFLILFIAVVCWKQNPVLKNKAILVTITGLVAICVAGPILMYLLKYPETYLIRTNQVIGWTPETMIIAVGEVNYWKYFWYQLTYSIGTYTVYPDPNGFYGPGLPLVFGPAGIMFIFGLVISLLERNWLPLAWLFFTTLFGGFMIGVPNSSAHYVAAIPAICWAIGSGLEWMKTKKYPRLAYILLGIILVVDLGFYFVYYATLPVRDFNMPFPLPPKP